MRLPGVEGRQLECLGAAEVRDTRGQIAVLRGPARLLDSRVLVGLTLQRASRVARAHHCVVRIVERQGRAFPITLADEFNRIDVAISDGRVTRVGVF